MVAGRARRLAVACLAAAVAACASPAGPGVPDSRRPTGPAITFVDPATLDLEARITQAVAVAADRGADVTIALLDRRTGRYDAFADAAPFETASVAKLFIADALLHADETGDTPLAPDEHALIARMLEFSDDDAANMLWDTHGGAALVREVADRYGLDATTVDDDAPWWSTSTTGADLVAYYAAVLVGRGGLDAPHRDELFDDLHRSSPVAADGYDQTFGIPAGLPGEATIAVKQGWMCCVDDRWTHVSTGVLGDDDRYVLVIVSREAIDYEGGEAEYPDTSQTAAVDDVSAAHARETVTEVVRNMFPQNRID